MKIIKIKTTYENGLGRSSYALEYCEGTLLWINNSKGFDIPSDEEFKSFDEYKKSRGK